MTRFAPNFAADSRGNPIKRIIAEVYLMKFRKLLKCNNCGNCHNYTTVPWTVRPRIMAESVLIDQLSVSLRLYFAVFCLQLIMTIFSGKVITPIFRSTKYLDL